MSKSDVIDKIKKCLAQAAGTSNDNEAATALRQAQKLMQIHGITDLGVDTADVSEQCCRAGARTTPPQWESLLASTVGRAFGCRVLFHKSFMHSEWGFIGCGAAPELAEYAFSVLSRQLRQARADHLKTLWRCKKANKTRRADLFCEGYVQAAAVQLGRFTVSSESEHAIGAYLTQFEVGHLTTRDRNAGRRLTDKEVTDYHRGRAAGKEARIHRGVGHGQGAASLSPPIPQLPLWSE